MCLSLEKASKPESNLLTLLSDQVLKEALLIVALSDNIHKQIVLLPEAVNLIVLVFNDGSFTMPSDSLIDVFFLSDVFTICVCEGCS